MDADADAEVAMAYEEVRRPDGRVAWRTRRPVGLAAGGDAHRPGDFSASEPFKARAGSL